MTVQLGKIMSIRRTHKNCGGTVSNRKCLKCGKTWSRVGYYTASDIEEKQTKRFDPDEYRRRIREGRDIPK